MMLILHVVANATVVSGAAYEPNNGGQVLVQDLEPQTLPQRWWQVHLGLDDLLLLLLVHLKRENFISLGQKIVAPNSIFAFL